MSSKWIKINAIEESLQQDDLFFKIQWHKGQIRPFFLFARIGVYNTSTLIGTFLKKETARKVARLIIKG